MSTLRGGDILHLAGLANLALSETEIKILKTQLSEVLSYFEELKELRTDDVSPTSQTTGLTDVLREDVVDPTCVLAEADALSGTEKTHNNSFVVGQVIRKEQ